MTTISVYYSKVIFKHAYLFVYVIKFMGDAEGEPA